MNGRATATAEFFDIHKIEAYRRDLGDVRFMPGHFDGKPGAAGAQAARNAFAIAREVGKRDPSTRLGSGLHRLGHG